MRGKHQQFADALLADPEMNATRVYRKVYPNSSEAAARRSASDLLTRPDISDYIAKRMKQRADRTGLTADRVLREISHAAFLDPIELFTESGTLRPLAEMPEHARRAIASIEVEETYEGGGKDRVWTGYLKKIRLVSKEGTLTLAGRHLGVFDDDRGPDVPMPVKVTVKIVDGRKDG